MRFQDVATDEEIEAVVECLPLSVIEAIERDEATDEQVAEVALAVLNVLNVSDDHVHGLCEAMFVESPVLRQQVVRAHQAATKEYDRYRASRRADDDDDEAPIKKVGRAVAGVFRPFSIMLGLHKTPHEKKMAAYDKKRRKERLEREKAKKAAEKAKAPKTAGLVGRLIGAAKKGMKMVFGKWRKVKNEGRYIPLSDFFE